MENVKIDINDLYKLLISDCRYGYTRNNHLMPGAAYENVKKYINEMYVVDKETALSTACQLVEECIENQLGYNFIDALDDENGNRKEAIDFINVLLNWIHLKGNDEELSYRDYKYYVPYNYNIYNKNIEKEASYKYRVYELDNFNEDANKIRELTTVPVSKAEADTVLFKDELKVTSLSYNKLNIMSEHRITGEIIKIITPTDFQDKVYSIELVK